MGKSVRPLSGPGKNIGLVDHANAWQSCDFSFRMKPAWWDGREQLVRLLGKNLMERRRHTCQDAVLGREPDLFQHLSKPRIRAQRIEPRLPFAVHEPGGAFLHRFFHPSES